MAGILTGVEDVAFRRVGSLPASRGVALSASGRWSGGISGLFAEVLRAWYPPPRSPQGQASSPQRHRPRGKRFYLGVGLGQGCVVMSAFQPCRKTGGESVNQIS